MGEGRSCAFLGSVSDVRPNIEEADCILCLHSMEKGYLVL